jgi:hypothetical protein
MHSLAISISASPIGPKTRVHSVREIEASEINSEET